MGVSKSFLRDLRDVKEWKEGVHWVYLNPANPTSGIRYNTDLCLHWLATRSCPDVHQREIAAYLAHLEGKKVDAQQKTAPSKRGRRL